MSEQVVLELGDDFAVESVNETLIPKIPDIKALSNLMSQIKYGFYSYEKEENVSNLSRMDKEYHLQAPETTIQKKVGICWDTVLVSKYYLNKLGYQTKMFFLRTKDNRHTHTLIFFKELRGNNKNVKWHWYEWSWGPFVNKDYNADTWEELLYSCAAFQWSKQVAGGDVQVFAVGKYPKIGCGPAQFMDTIVNNKLLGTVNANRCEFVPAGGNQATEALEDYLAEDSDGNPILMEETVDGVYADLPKEQIFALMRSYVDDTIDDSTCEHILRHYIANSLQHQWWVHYFTQELGKVYYLDGKDIKFTYGDKKTTSIIPAGYQKLMIQMYKHDYDKLHNLNTVAAYSVRVYNQHWDEGSDLTHELHINDKGEEAIFKAWSNHVKTNVHHPETWDRNFKLVAKDLPEDQYPPCHAESMEINPLIELAGDWMAASLLRHKTALGWFNKTNGKRFIFSQEQQDLLLKLFSHEERLVAEVEGRNPFASESFGVDSNVVPADIHGVNRIGEEIKVYSVDPVTGKKQLIGTTNDTKNLLRKDVPLGKVPETDAATEALGGSKTKKQRIIDYVVGCMDLLDPTKDNSRRFSDMVNAMNDKQFAEYMKNLKEHKVQIDILIPNMVKNLQVNDIFAAAKKINCKLFERVWFYDMTTGKEFLSTEELPIFRVTVRRQEQMLDEKLSVPDRASKIDTMTGQVTGDDRAGGFSQPEIQIMYSKGFKSVLKEFVKVRGGDVHAFADFERQLEEQGAGSMDQIKVASRARSGAVLSTWLEAIHLENNV